MVLYSCSITAFGALQQDKRRWFAIVHRHTHTRSLVNEWRRGEGQSGISRHWFVCVCVGTQTEKTDNLLWPNKRRMNKQKQNWAQIKKEVNGATDRHGESGSHSSHDLPFMHDERPRWKERALEFQRAMVIPLFARYMHSVIWFLVVCALIFISLSLFCGSFISLLLHFASFCYWLHITWSFIIELYSLHFCTDFCFMFAFCCVITCCNIKKNKFILEITLTIPRIQLYI